MSLKFINLRLWSNLPGANELSWYPPSHCCSSLWVFCSRCWDLWPLSQGPSPWRQPPHPPWPPHPVTQGHSGASYTLSLCRRGSEMKRITLILVVLNLLYHKKHKKYICIFYHFSKQGMHRSLKSYITEDKDPFSCILNSQYHGCWWSGDARSQGISTHVLTPYFWDIPVFASEGLNKWGPLTQFFTKEISIPKDNIFTSCLSAIFNMQWHNIATCIMGKKSELTIFIYSFFFFYWLIVAWWRHIAT